nr:MAG: hypothetical protein [Bacteriophage sp.]
MFETFQTIINAGGYDLADLTQRIKTMYVMGELTEDEMKQLLEQAQDNAKPDESYAPLADRVKAIEEWETTIEERLSKLESGSSTDPGDPEDPADEWPEYKQPTGAHDAFHVGDKITYTGKQYTYIYDGCVWTPDTSPQGRREEA